MPRTVTTPEADEEFEIPDDPVPTDEELAELENDVEFDDAEISPQDEEEPQDDSEVAEQPETQPESKNEPVLSNGEQVGQLVFEPLTEKTQKEIFETRREIIALDSEIAVISAGLKAKKAIREEAVQELMSLLKLMEIESEPNLFNSAKKETVEADTPAIVPAAAESDASTTVEIKDPAQDDESWKTFKLSDLIPLGMPAKAVERMEAKGVATIGDVQRWTEPSPSGYQRRLTDAEKDGGFGGIGPATAEKIENALAKFWEVRPDKGPPSHEVG